ncbi:MAG: endonuclease/exonuclease/phosphatase family protein [Clostridia bacterium]|nr:endonuclease/exonuclease/phosphatase family protein [Clostridia bacterium]
MDQNITLMSYNTRINSHRDGEYQLYPYRISYVIEFLRDCGADIIGLQEVQPPTRRYLTDSLSAQYGIVGMGRNADYEGEACCILYRKDKFDLLSYDTFWLSPTPGVPDSRPHGVWMPRICTTATLLPRGEGVRDAIRVYNSHVYHVKDERLSAYGIYLILDRIRRDAELMKYPIALMGDFNCTPDSMAIEAINKYEPIKLTDATAGLDYTYHEYERESLIKTKIDYIFTDAEIVPGSAERVTQRRKRDGMFLSDHYPVKVTVKL